MKEKWNNLIDHIQKLIDDDCIVINGLRNGPDVTKIKKNFERNVKTVSKLIEEFSVFIPDPEADNIEMPFDSSVFIETWKDYKDFLYQVFGIILVPVEERRRLKKLAGISKNNEERALDYLDFYICSRYKSIFLPKDIQQNNDQPGDEPAKETGFSLNKRTI